MNDEFKSANIAGEEDTTEATEKMFATEGRDKFEIVLDIVKVNTSAVIDNQ